LGKARLLTKLEPHASWRVPVVCPWEAPASDIIADLLKAGRREMPNEWPNLTDDKLADIAQEGITGQGAPVEAMRCLRVAIEQSSAKSDTYSRRMFWLNIILAVLTLVQAIAVGPAVETMIKQWLS
jgi:hypothetical protein